MFDAEQFVWVETGQLGIIFPSSKHGFEISWEVVYVCSGARLNATCENLFHYPVKI